MKSRITVACLVFASLLLMKPLAFGQSTDPGAASTDTAQLAQPATESTTADVASNDAAPAETPATDVQPEASVATDAPAAVEEPAATTEPEAAATTPEAAATTDVMTSESAPAAEMPAATETAPVGTTATAAPAEAAATAAPVEGEASSAQVIELTPEEQSVPGAEITAKPGDENKISVTLDNVPLQDVIRMFTRISGANIVSGTNLVGNVTVNLQDVEWEPALKVILDVVDMALVEKAPGIYAVIPKGQLSSEPVISETIFLSFSTVSNILPVINKMLISTNASVAGFPAANAIVIQETRPRLNQIKEAVSKIDKPRHQVLIEAKFVELNDQAIKDLGINWQVLQGYTIGLRAPEFDFQKTRTDRETQNNVTTEHQNQHDSQASVGAELNSSGKSKDKSQTDTGNSSASASSGSSFSSTPPDAPTLTDDSSSEQSASANSDSSAFNDSFSANQSSHATANVSGRNFDTFDAASGKITDFPVWDQIKTATDFTENETISALGAILNAQDFELTLSALKQNSGVEIISNPKIVVASGERATIHVGVKLPNYEVKNETGAGNTVVPTRSLSGILPFVDTGVIVDVEPTVNTESNITVKIIPELSRTLPNPSGFTGDIPPIQTRRIESQFNLESGRTVAIGGLTQSDEREAVTKIPFLGDIPVIGKYLFSHTHTERSQDEVIIFVTVAIANPASLVQSSGIPEEGKLIYRHLARRVEESAREANESSSGKKKKSSDWISTKR